MDIRNGMARTRREFFRALGAIALGAGAAWAKDEPCDPAVRTDAGPFYPRSPIPGATDLTRQPGTKGRARGQLLQVFGRVIDVECKPVAGARVEIWQADAEGRYWHPGAAEQDQLDPNFRYFAHTLSDDDGRYTFKTIVPSRYTFGDLERAPHIHYRVHAEGFRALTTELYFRRDEDETLRQGDQVWLSRPAETRARLVVPLETAQAYAKKGMAVEKGAHCCTFDLQLEASRG